MTTSEFVNKYGGKTTGFLLVGGEVVLIDLEDIGFLEEVSLIYLSNPGNNKPYLRVETNGKKQYFHRIIMNPGKKQIDHINRNTFDNRKVNLRCVTQQENLRNQKRANNKTGFTGVAIYNIGSGGYTAQIKHNYKKYHLGVFKTVEDARKAREEAETRFGWI